MQTNKLTLYKEKKKLDGKVCDDVDDICGPAIRV